MRSHPDSSPVNRSGGPEKAASANDITKWLRAWSEGDQAAEQKVLTAVYDELRRLAKMRMRGERDDHTLEPTGLVHEAYLRLVDLREIRWRDRGHFLSAASQTMRRILIDHARSRVRKRRGGDLLFLPLDEGRDKAVDSHEILRFDEALQRLESYDPDKAKLVEMRFYAGLSIEEVALALSCSRATVIRQWRQARGWLRRFIRERESDGS